MLAYFLRVEKLEERKVRMKADKLASEHFRIDEVYKTFLWSFYHVFIGTSIQYMSYTGH